MNSWPLLATEPITTNLTWSFCTYQELLSRQAIGGESSADLCDIKLNIMLWSWAWRWIQSYSLVEPMEWNLVHMCVPIPNQTATHQSKGNGITWNRWKFTSKKLSCSAFWSGNRARKPLISNKWNSLHRLCIYYTAIS